MTTSTSREKAKAGLSTSLRVAAFHFHVFILSFVVLCYEKEFLNLRKEINAPRRSANTFPFFNLPSMLIVARAVAKFAQFSPHDLERMRSNDAESNYQQTKLFGSNTHKS